MRALLPALLLCVACSGAVKVEVPPQVAPADSTLDFGALAVGEVVTRGVQLTVHGGGGLTIDKSTVPTGFSATIGPNWMVVVTLTPDVEGDYAGTIVVSAGESLARVHVAATVYPWLVDPVGTSLAFDPVKVDESEDKPVRIRNDLSIPAQVALVTDDTAFSVWPEELTLNPGTHADVMVSFHPRQRGRFAAVLRVAPCPICNGRRVSLLGYGRAEHFQLTGSLDFGKQLVGSSACQAVTAFNDGDFPLYFLSVKIEGSQDATSPFSLTIDPLLQPGSSVGPGQSAEARVCFEPVVLGRVYQAELLFHRSTGFDTRLAVTGTSSGPILAADPTAIDLGVTPPGQPAARELLIEAAGDRGPLVLDGVELQGDPAFHLQYPDGDPAGHDVAASPLRVRVVMDGIEGAHTAFAVAHAMYRQDLVVPLQGGVVEGEPCELDVPDQVQFGMVHEPSSPVRSLVIHNRGATACPVWGFTVDPPSPDFSYNRFALVNPPSGITLIPPDGDLTVDVAYQSAGNSLDPDHGTLHFRRFPHPSVDRPTIDVALYGFATMLDLSVSPDPIDFGPVERGSTAHVVAELSNNSVRLVLVGGNQPPPNPAGDIAMSTDSPAGFSVSGLPPYGSMTLAGGGTMTFSVDFAATEPGHYQGLLEVWLRDAPAPILVPVVADVP